MAAYTTKTKLYVFCVFLVIKSNVCGWEVDKYPNPNVDLDSCGRGGKRSWICDPDGVLSEGEADGLETWLAKIQQETDSDCGDSSQEKGFEIAVALLKSMDLLEGESTADGAVRFARSLHDSWGVGKKGCNDGVLIFLSVEERQIYISTGRKAKEKLTNEQLDLIVVEIVPHLREKMYARALEETLKHAQNILEGKPLVSPWNVGFVLSLVFCCVFILSVAAVIWDYFQQKRLKEFKHKLNRIDDERKDPKEYKTLVCPICLEDFTTQIKVKLLLCGHKYCEPCLTEWLKTKTSCPICRQAVDRDARKDTEPDSFLELRYRLSSLYNQYPNFVNEDMIAHWLSPNFHGTFLDYVNQRSGHVLGSGITLGGSLGREVSFGGGDSRGGGGSGGTW